MTENLRRARATALSMIPTKTGAAAAVGLVLPDLAGRLDGFAIRVPTPNVSMVDLVFHAARETSVEEIHELLRAAADGPLKGILQYNEAPLVSFDSFGDSALMINLRVYISSIDYRIAVNTSLHKAINSRFAEAGIVIAFPQRHLHLETPSPLRIRVEEDRVPASPEV